MEDNTATTAGQTLARDTTLSLLSDSVRRTTLEALDDEGTPVGVAELATVIAAQQGDANPVDAVRTQLHHSHLPKLDDAGVIDYNPSTNTVDSCFFERLPRLWSEG